MMLRCCRLGRMKRSGFAGRSGEARSKGNKDMPVYLCKIAGTKEERVVRARSAAQARAHLVDAEPLSAEALADALSKEGAKLETADAPVEAPPAQQAPAKKDGE